MKGFLISSVLLLLAVFALPLVRASTIDAAVTTDIVASAAASPAPAMDVKHDVGVVDGVANTVAIWYPGKYLRERRASARASGGWYPGRGVLSGFGSAGGC